MAVSAIHKRALFLLTQSSVFLTTLHMITQRNSQSLSSCAGESSIKATPQKLDEDAANQSLRKYLAEGGLARSPHS